MDDFGMAVSLPGYDAATAPGQFLYFSSSWPLLKIDESISGTLTLTGTPADYVTHNLNYPPFVMVWSHANGFYPYYISSINYQTVVFNSFQATENVGDTIRYYIFRNPLNINFQAPTINIAGSGEGQPAGNFGIKFSKPGYDSSTDTDYRHFTIHSATKSLQVHQVIYQQLGQFEDTNLGLPDFPSAIGLKYITDLPYDPVYFAFFSSDNINFIPLFAISQSLPKIEYNSIDGGIIIYANEPGWGVFYILLDPYQSTDITNVTI